MPKQPAIFRLVKATAQRAPDTRTSASNRGYDARWRAARASYLQANPLCAECARYGCTEAATVVDHITPHKGNDVLFWDDRNWQALCARCHNRKTARQPRSTETRFAAMLRRSGVAPMHPHARTHNATEGL